MKIALKENIKAPLETVFQLFADIGQAASRVSGIEKVEVLTDGPIGVGTRFRETRKMFGHESSQEMEITQFTPLEFYIVEADSCGAHFQSTFRFRERGEFTEVELEFETQATSLYAKLLSPLSFLMAGSMKKMMQTDIQELKLHCEESTSIT